MSASAARAGRAWRRIWRPREGRHPAAAGAAEVALRSAALLRGGVAPRRVFGLLAADAAEGSPLSRICDRIDRGESVSTALAAGGGPEWRTLAAAWRLAEASGAPLAPALERIGAALAEIDRLRERRSVLLAGPRATVRLVACLPLLALLLGWLMGFDPLPVLLSGSGAILLSLGVALLASGMLWAKELDRRVERDDRVAGLELELVWIALGGGAAPGTAVLRVTDCVDRVAVDWVPFDAFCRSGLLQETIRTAATIGVPLDTMLLPEAASARARSLAELERVAERLGVRILAPIGLCVLPSFIVLGVVPVVMSMLGGSAL